MGASSEAWACSVAVNRPRGVCNPGPAHSARTMWREYMPCVSLYEAAEESLLASLFCFKFNSGLRFTHMRHSLFLYKFLQHARWLGPAKVVALEGVAAQAGQEVALGSGFHTLSDYRQAQVVA
jgi:hypothetical protein